MKKKIASGFPTLDQILDHIQLGDNVVLQVINLNDFKKLADAFVNQSISDQRNVIYIRFAKHEPLIEPKEGLKIYTLNPACEFEAFTTSVHEIISNEGKEAFYVFDSLSDLQVAWSTDLMMGNFFCVTCPYLFELDTVAFFPVLRGHHDYGTIARIQDTTQIFLDIYSNDQCFYIHPIKVWARYSTEMFLPHRLNPNNEFESLTNSVDFSDYYNLIHGEHSSTTEQNMDSYERFFLSAKTAYSNGTLDEWTLSKICRSMMTHDHRMTSFIKEAFSPEDFFFIKERVIGTGTIGGKACGMLLARKIIEKHLPQYSSYMEPHDSFFIGTDGFYSYIVENNLWKIRVLQNQDKYYFSKGEELRKLILKGHFPANIRAQFRRMLAYFGQIPIIVRSSSFLEDGFGNAFAGKYESVFCVNSRDPEERLKNFEDAVRQVYASTMDPSALEYRKKRGMDKCEEQMAILVQRVSGTRFGDYYMPCLAGVGFSYSVYRWSDELDPNAGLLRLVAGLGTKAVDRTGIDYPRLVNLDKPESTSLVSGADKHRFSQRHMDIINTKTNELTEIPDYLLIPQLQDWYKNLICEHDYEAEQSYAERGITKQVLFISCHNAVKNTLLMKMMKDILSTLQEHYHTPVDIEYTINFRPDGAFNINLLQCRPLHVWPAVKEQVIPEISKENTLFQIEKTFMGNHSFLKADVIVWIDSVGYHNCAYKQKSTFGSIVGQINQYYKDSGKTLMLISPGRIGTSSPELGISLNFSDISNFSIICEYEDAEIGLTPELSYGSHMFQDIVETNMFYIAIMNTHTNAYNYFCKKYFTEDNSSHNGNKNLLKEITAAHEAATDIIKVYEMDEDRPLSLYADFKNQKVIVGFFEP